jgi:hypothetical protein
VTEYQLHLQVAKFLNHALTGRSTWFHPPNGGYRHATEARRLKAMGVLPGIPDIVVINDGRMICFELKAPKGGRVSVAQLRCHKQLEFARVPVFICKTLEEVVSGLEIMGVPLKAKVAA